MAESKWVTHSDSRAERQAKTRQCSASWAGAHSPGHCHPHRPAGCRTKDAFQQASPEHVAQQHWVRLAGEHQGHDAALGSKREATAPTDVQSR